MSATYNKLHAVTVIAAVALVAHRFVAYDNAYASSAGGTKDSRGVSEHDAPAGSAVAVTTGYSQLVEAGAPIAYGDYIKAGTDGVAVPGTANDHCGRALGEAATAGVLVEVQILNQVHATGGD